MPNPPIVIGQQGKVLKNERVDVWLDGTSGDDSKDGFSQANAKKTDLGIAALIDGAKFGAECRLLVINVRGTNVISSEGSAHWELNSSDVEDAPGWVKPKVIIDGGTDLTELLASTATTGSTGGLNEIMALLNDIKTQYNLHLSRGVGVGHAGGPDAANVITAANATDYLTAVALATEIQTNYAAHIADIVVHGPGTADTTNVLSTDPPYDLKSLTEAANDIKAQYNAHIVDVTGAPALHDAVGADLATVANATKATAITGTSLTVAAAGWTNHQWRGYWCEFLSGPLAGETYLIRGNDTDTIYFNGDWTLDPGTGSNFRIVRPATVIDGTFGASFYTFGVNMRGVGDLHLQNFTTTNGAMLESNYSEAAAKGSVNYSHIVMECLPFQIFPISQVPMGARLEIGPNLLDCSTPDCDPVVNPTRMGLSQNADCFAVAFFARVFAAMYDSVLPQFGPADAQFYEALDCSFTFADVRYCNLGRPTHPGFARCRIGDPIVASALPALRLEASQAWITGGVFSNAEHGIEALKGSHVSILGGMGDNTKTGVYCHTKSSCDQFRSYGATGNCEITGNSGTVELSEDGVTEVSKWNALDGLPVSTPDCSAGQYIDNAASPWWDNLAGR